jgi:membrane-bound metal-dependent hydrolase YbcI (DUF457 family)
MLDITLEYHQTPIYCVRKAAENRRSESLRRYLGRIFLASFAVHLGVGLSGSALAATSMLAANLASPVEMLAYLMLGTIGSLLPDLDADNSMPIQISFTALSIVLAFAGMFWLTQVFTSVIELLVIWCGIYLFFRWLVFALFTHLTTHRGIFHSVPAAAFFGLITAIAAERLGGQAPLQAWAAGGFVSFGYLLHLVLDEIYSVNLFGLRTKRSFGTAFKFWSSNSHAASLYLYAACIGLCLLAPERADIIKLLSSPQTYVQIRDRLLPRSGWFQPPATFISDTLRLR